MKGNAEPPLNVRARLESTPVLRFIFEINRATAAVINRLPTFRLKLPNKCGVEGQALK